MQSQDGAIAGAADPTRIAGRRNRVDAFVRAHYGIRGSLRLHRAGLGLDILRAPVNVALAPMFLLTRLVALAASLMGLKRAAGWLLRRRILLKTSIARAVEAHLTADLLADLAKDAGTAALPDRHRQLVEDYVSVRTAVSEITTTSIVLACGFAIFHSATPGLVSLTPMVSDYMAQATAISDFALGERLGGLWYGLFPPRLPVWHVIAIGAALAMVASLVTTFAGLLADPIQTALGIHRRRLMRLLASIDAADSTAPPLAREHFLARAADISDAGVSLFRFFRP